MTIYISGRDARAHAFAWKNSEKREADKIYCIPGNPGTKAFSDDLPENLDECVIDIKISEPEILWETAENSSADCLEISMMYDGENSRFFPTVETRSFEKMILCDPKDSVSDDHKALFAENIEKMCCGDKKGFYTLRFGLNSKTPCAFIRGLSFSSACALLPLIKGDFIRYYNAVESGINESFDITMRTESVCVLAIEGESGMIISGLDELEGDIGVFINNAQNVNDKLLSSGARPLYICAREKNKRLALQRAQDAVMKIKLL